MIGIATIMELIAAGMFGYMLGKSHEVKRSQRIVNNFHELLTKMVDEYTRIMAALQLSVDSYGKELVALKLEQTTMLRSQITALESFIHDVMDDISNEDEDDDVEEEAATAAVEQSAARTALELHTKLSSVKKILTQLKNSAGTIGKKELDGLLHVVNYEDKSAAEEN